MAFISDTTSLSANSFVTVADATSYFADLYGYDAWAGLSTTIKEQLLVTASQRINQEQFRGTATTDLRDLQFPKTGVYDRFGDLISSTVVPKNIQNAVFEQAFSYQVTGLFDADELADMELVSNMSESDAGISRSYTFKKVDASRICSKARKQLKLIPNIWISGLNVSNIVR